MGQLVVVAFDAEDTADQVRDRLETLQKAELVGLEDVVVVKRHENGKVKVKQAINLTGAGAASGSFWGMLIGFLFMAPWLGMAIGAMSGGLSGHLSDIGIDDDFIKSVAASIPKGGSAIFMLVAHATPEKAVAALEDFNGTVLHTNLSGEDEAKLREAFGEEVSA